MNLIRRRTFHSRALAHGSALALTGTWLRAFAQAPDAGWRPSRKYRACVIGHTGRGGYGHGLDTCFQGVPEVKVIAVADPVSEACARTAKQLGAQSTYADWREMLQREKPDLVSIGPRWVEQRVEMVSAAAALGAHVYMEKPLAKSLEDADRIVEAVNSAKTKLALAFHSLNAPTVLHLKKLVDDGLLGDLLEVRTRGKEDHRSGGEDMTVLGTHCLYLLRLFAGSPSWCTARIQEKGRDVTRADAREATEPLGPVAGDSIQATYAFPGGWNGYFASQKLTKGPGGRFQCQLIGSKGQAIIHIGMDPEVYFLADPLGSPGKSKTAWQTLPGAPSNRGPSGLEGQDAANQRLVLDLLRAAETGTKPVAGVEEGRAVLEMIHAVYEAHLSGGRAMLPLPKRQHPLTG